MSAQDKQEAADKAARAARQARHAANNAGGAAEAAAEYAKDEIVDAAVSVKDGAAELAKKAIYTEVGRGALLLGLGIGTVFIGAKRLGEARALRAEYIANAAQARIVSDAV